MKKWEYYAEVAFNAMKSNQHLWSIKEYQRPITRLLYDQVFCAGRPNKSDLISVSAMKNKLKKIKSCEDHCIIPQFVARMVMDHPDDWLVDLEKFKELFFWCCRTIEVTPEENNKLSKLTENKDGTFIVHVPTHLRYKHLGINLYHPELGSVDNVFDIPSELIEYEKQYLVA